MEVKEIRLKQADGSFVEAEVEYNDGVLFVSPKVENVEPKDGDVLNVDGSILIFRCIRGSVNKSLESYAVLTPSGLFIDKIVCYKALKYATKEEAQTLLNKLKDEGLEFDPEKRGIVKLKWKPKFEEPYYSPSFSNIDFLFKTSKYIYTGHLSDELTIQKMRAFKTKEECQLFCDKLNQTIEEYQP